MEQKEKFVLPELTQVGFVVKDIEQVANYYSTALGIGPFRVFDLDIPDATLHGKPISLKLRVAFARKGPIQMELIEVPEGESIYREFFEKKGEGLHHLGFHVTDIDTEVAKLARSGIGVLQGGKFSDGGFAYLDTERFGGVIFELIQRPPR